MIPAVLAERLVTPRPDCQIWTGATDRGYGRVWHNGTAARVHRIAWEHVNGPVPEGYELHHECEVRACANLDHLRLVTRAEHKALTTKRTPLTGRFRKPRRLAAT